jgi:hypothetical protein
MPGKKRKKKFSAAKAVKSVARDLIGSPPATRQVEPKTRKSREKHKPTLGKMLSSEE